MARLYSSFAIALMAAGDLRGGLQAADCYRLGRKPKYLFSGLLCCGLCGARFVIADRTHYACSLRVNGGTSACSSDVRIKRTLVEGGLRDAIKSDLLSPEVVTDIERETRRALKARAPRALTQSALRPRRKRPAISSRPPQAGNCTAPKHLRSGWRWRRRS